MTALQYKGDCTFCIHRSTGRLCVDLALGNGPLWDLGLGEISRPQEIMHLGATDETMVIESLTLKQYHTICYYNLSQNRTISVLTNVTLDLAGVFACSSDDQLDNWVQIVSLPDVEVGWTDWNGAEGKIMDNGWTRYVLCVEHDLA